MNIKEVFAKADESGSLTLSQFEAIMKENGAKFADLSEGKYVSKSKYEDDLADKDKVIEAKDVEISNRDTRIEELNGTITTRDNDLADLQKQLEAAGEDATKLESLNSSLKDLQTKYDNDVKAYEGKMKQQAYEFAVKEFANTKKFSSNAAKRDFVQSMIAKGLQMDGDRLIGGEDFVKIYSEENSDAFYVEPEPTPDPDPTPEPDPEPQPAEPAPTFVAAAPGPEPNSDAGSGFQFNFQGVRAH